MEENEETKGNQFSHFHPALFLFYSHPSLPSILPSFQPLLSIIM